MMFSETRRRAERLLAGLSFRNPFVRVVLNVALLSIVLTAFAHVIVCRCWTAARASTSSSTALQIYTAGCLAIGICAAAAGATRVVGVDVVEAAVRDAEANARANGLSVSTPSSSSPAPSSSAK